MCEEDDLKDEEKLIPSGERSLNLHAVWPRMRSGWVDEVILFVKKVFSMQKYV